MAAQGSPGGLPNSPNGSQPTPHTNQPPSWKNFPPHQRFFVSLVVILVIILIIISISKLGFSSNAIIIILGILTFAGAFFFGLAFFREPIEGALHDFSAWLAKAHRLAINGAKQAISKLITNFSKTVAIPLIVSLVVSLIVSLITLGMFRNPFSISTPQFQCDSQKIAPISANGIGVFQAADGKCTGLSDGAFAFDSDRPGGNGDLKRQAVEKFNLHDIQASKSLWQQELAVDSNDAETLIYLENQRIQSSPHITLVVATMLTGKYVNIGRDNLQGAYIAQKEYNDGYKLPGGLQLRLLIANFGSDPANATKVANQIVQAQRADPTIVGVMGLPFSSYVPDTIEVLAKAHIPMVSQSASSDDLTGISPYFFRIVPPNKVQAKIGARYAVQQLHAHKIALFYDPGDSYSDSLGEDFRQQVLALGGTIVASEPYIVGQPEKLPGLLQDAQSHHPDLLYFAGHATDLNTLLVDLPTSELSTHVLVMGGDALYEVKDYTSSAGSGFLLLRFTAFAYPDEWMYLGVQKPSFFTEYQSAFDPDNQHSADPYGYSRPDNNVIVSYDATMVLLNAYQIALPQGKTSLLTPDELRIGLTHTTDAQEYQGISGQISFGKNGDPINKAIVILYVDPSGFIRLESIKSNY